MIDNLRMAVAQEPRRERAAAIDRAIERFPGARATRRSQRAGSLSGGEQQMLALARALAVSPKLVIADEMSLGLAPLVAESVFESLEEARRSGITIVLSEQFVHRALAMADSCVILTRGRVGWAGPASEAGQEVIDRYLGEAENPTADCPPAFRLRYNNRPHQSRNGDSPESALRFASLKPRDLMSQRSGEGIMSRCQSARVLADPLVTVGAALAAAVRSSCRCMLGGGACRRPAGAAVRAPARRSPSPTSPT